MNERIKELAEQCGFRSNPNIYDRNQSFDIEKFAELIVKECVSKVRLRQTFAIEDEHQVEDARSMAKQLGFKRFTVKDSTRFSYGDKTPVVDTTGQTIYYLESATGTPISFVQKQDLNNFEQYLHGMTVDCRVKKTKEVYIDAYKNLYPCCWLGNVPYSNFKSHEWHSKLLMQNSDIILSLGGINLLDKSVKELVESNQYQTVWNDYWSNKKLLVCLQTCGTKSQVTVTTGSYQAQRQFLH